MSFSKEFARRGLRAACAAALRLRSRPLALSPRGTTLVIAPHPDDESLGCGALIAARAAAGADVRVAFFTDGAASGAREPGLAKRREDEARAAMAAAGIGGDALRFLGAPDGRLKDLDAAERERWTAAFAALLAEMRPAEVLLPSRDDGSSEHEAMFRLFAAALGRSDPRPRVLEFPVWSWWNPRFLQTRAFGTGSVWRHDARPHLATKAAMIRCHLSQTGGPHPVLSPAMVRAFHGPSEFYFGSDDS